MLDAMLADAALLRNVRAKAPADRLPKTPSDNPVEYWELVYLTMTDTLKEYAADYGSRGCIIGLSGGLDSALVAALMCDVLPPETVNAIFMPGPYTAPECAEYARRMSRDMGFNLYEVPIGPLYGQFAESYVGGIGKMPCDTACQNVQARLRMTILFAMSNDTNLPVVNTSNYSERMVGYATLHGDATGAFSPLGEILKTEVVQLAIAQNRLAAKHASCGPICPEVIERPPSAELTDDQTDEGCLGMTYDELDPLLCLLEGRDMTPEEASQALGVDVELAENIWALITGNAFKRRMAPMTVLRSEYGLPPLRNL